MSRWPEITQDARMWLSRKSVRSLAPPDWLSVNLTLRCNLSCTMCTTCYDAPEMSTREVLDLVDQAARMGVKVFNPLGGEPFLRNDLEEILAHAVRRGLFVTLTTNGTLVNRRRAEKIAAIPPENLHLNLSLDGPPSVHDKIRGEGMYQRSIAAYHLLREADEAAGNTRRKITVNTVLNRQSAPVFLDFLDTLFTEGFSAVQILTLFRNRTSRAAEELWFDEPSLPALDALVEALALRAQASDGIPIQNRPADLRLLPRYFREGLRPLEAPCWAGWKELYVNADGKAIMCDGNLDFRKGTFGDVRASTLSELWESPALKARRQVVKACHTPCIQGCYLRHGSDDVIAIGRSATRELLRPLARELRRHRPWRTLPGLTLELSDVPADPSHARLRALLRRSPTPLPALTADPRLYDALRDQGRLDTGTGFLGAEVLERILLDLSSARLRVERLALWWRGEALFHPSWGHVLAVLSAARARGQLGTALLQTDGALLREALPGVEVWVTPGPFEGRAAPWGGRVGTAVAPEGPVIAWDGKIARSRLVFSERFGDALGQGDWWEGLS